MAQLSEQEEQTLDQLEQIASIKVIGVGGAGNNAINRMIEAGVQGVDFIAVNTDAQVLSINKAPVKIILGKKLSKGLGAGADPEIGKKAATESIDELKQALAGADMVFVAAGMGGGTGTGAAPIISKIARELGALTLAIVTKPFRFEGRLRNSYALEGTEELRKVVDSLIIVSNDKLLQVIGSVPLKDSFREADNVLRQAVQSITDIVAIPALINLDFADVKTVTEDKGDALIGIGVGRGEEKAKEAASKAVQSPLLEASIAGATSAVVNVTGGKTMSLFDAQEAVDVIKEAAGTDVNVIFGVALNEHLDDEMIVTVIATGFSNNQASKSSTNGFNADLAEPKPSLSDRLYEASASASSKAKKGAKANYNKFNSNGEPNQFIDREADSEDDDSDDDLPPFLRRG